MARTMKNLIGTGIRKGDYNVEFTMVWNDPDDSAATFRRIQADTYRVAAAIAECSENARWCIDPHADCGILGRGLLGTYIRIELADGTEAEMALAEILVRQIVAGIKN